MHIFDGFSFVRSDAIGDDGRVWNPGTYGHVWASRAYANVRFANGFNLLLAASVVYPSSNTDRFWGYPLRCLVR